MPSQKGVSRQLFRQTHFLLRDQLRLGALRCWCDCKCGCQEGGKCDCGPDCGCKKQKKTKKKVCVFGVRPICCRDPPSNYESKELGTKAFQIPDYMNPRAFRPMEADEVLGPNAAKSNLYKNPEFYSYHRFSYHELKEATLEAKKASDPGLMKELFPK